MLPNFRYRTGRLMTPETTHTFAICAFGESPFLEECILSLKNQTLKPSILLATSTPNCTIKSLAKKYDIPIYINENTPGIASDWNFAIDCASTDYITIAHQDDVYCPEYLSEFERTIAVSQNPLLYFTNYGEIRNGTRVDVNRLLRIKRRLLKPLEQAENWPQQSARKRALSIGSSICCPSVTLVRNKLSNPPFKTNFKSNLDWQAWAELAECEGDFVYNPRILMYHRIHEGSETTRLIKDRSRTAEDLAMLEKFWPKPLARIINAVYSKGQISNS